ncbi:MAG: RluA family pseudouridine synthase [Treponema sp.]
MAHTTIHRIFYEDAYCAVVYKKIGEDSQSFFTELFPDKSFVQPVNRLDKPVSGLILAAFSPQIQAVCSRSFADGQAEKEYWAVCLRPAEQPEPVGFQRLEQYLSFNTKKQKAFLCRDVSPLETHKVQTTGNTRDSVRSARNYALLYWKQCGTGKRYDFLKIFPKTGRTHQIRVQMAAIGRPIKGDLKYGAPRSEKNGGIRLHAYSLRLPHPVTGDILAVSALPQEPDALWAACTTVCTSDTEGCPQ